MGLSAVPLPNNLNPPSALAFNKPLPSVAAAAPGVTLFPNSRRVTANAVHINGAAPGTSPEPPDANQDTRFPPRPRTAPDSATSGAAAAISADPATVGATAATTGIDTDAADCADDRPAAGDVDGTPSTPGVANCIRGAKSNPDDGGLAAAPVVASAEPTTGGDMLSSKSCPPGAPIATEPVESPRAAEPAAARTARPAATPSPDEEAAFAVRPERPAGPPARVEEPGEFAALEPVDPGEPVESAKVTGIAAAAEPIPNATASAPTRPTYRA